MWRFVFRVGYLPALIFATVTGQIWSIYWSQSLVYIYIFFPTPLEVAPGTSQEDRLFETDFSWTPLGFLEREKNNQGHGRLDIFLFNNSGIIVTTSNKKFKFFNIKLTCKSVLFKSTHHSCLDNVRVTNKCAN